MALYIDPKAAYGWIPRNLLRAVLRARTQAHILIDILEELYTNTSANIAGLKF